MSLRVQIYNGLRLLQNIFKLFLNLFLAVFLTGYFLEF